MARKGITQVMVGLFVVSVLFAVVFNLLYSARFSSTQPFLTQYLYHVISLPLLLVSTGFLIVSYLLGKGDRVMGAPFIKGSRYLGLLIISIYLLSILISLLTDSSLANRFAQFFLSARLLFLAAGGLLAFDLGGKTRQKG